MRASRRPLVACLAAPLPPLVAALALAAVAGARPTTRRLVRSRGSATRGHATPRSSALARGAGPRVVRARAHRHSLQMGRQHARDGPRLQRPRPLRVPAGHRRHAAAHGEGHEPPRRARSRLPDLQPGDLVFFNTRRFAFSHVGIYLGDNRFVHAPRRGREVEVATLDQSYWQKRFNGARRLVGVLPELVPAAGDAAAAIAARTGTGRGTRRRTRRDGRAASPDAQSPERTPSRRRAAGARPSPPRCRASPSRARSRRSGCGD